LLKQPISSNAQLVVIGVEKYFVFCTTSKRASLLSTQSHTTQNEKLNRNQIKLKLTSCFHRTRANEAGGQKKTLVHSSFLCVNFPSRSLFLLALRSVEKRNYVDSHVWLWIFALFSSRSFLQCTYAKIKHYLSRVRTHTSTDEAVETAKERERELFFFVLNTLSESSLKHVCARMQTPIKSLRLLLEILIKILTRSHFLLSTLRFAIVSNRVSCKVS
jgi:hypothetical protein